VKHPQVGLHAGVAAGIAAGNGKDAGMDRLGIGAPQFSGGTAFLPAIRMMRHGFLRRYYPDQVDGFDLSTRTPVRQHPDMAANYITWPQKGEADFRKVPTDCGILKKRGTFTCFVWYNGE
jgi:hypothetical protein